MNRCYPFLIVFLGLGLLLSACKPESLAPVLDSIDPVFGPEETLVTIEGSNLANVQAITFSGVPINFNTAYNADHALLFRIPTTVPLGDHEVVLRTAGGEITTNFKVTNEPPEVFRLSPESGGPGETITIYGENFFEPVEVFFFDSVQAEVTLMTEDSLKVIVPDGIQQGFVQVVANGGVAQSPKRFFSVRTILVNDFDGNGVRHETNKWVFQGNLDQNAFNAIHNSNPEPIQDNFLKISGTDELDIQWIGGVQNHFGFPGDDFETFGLTASTNNVLLELDINNNGREDTHIILILNEKDGSPNDFTHDIHVDWEGWQRVSVPLNRFKDLNEIIVAPEKIRVVKVHLIDEEQTKTQLEVNIDNLQFIERL